MALYTVHVAQDQKRIEALLTQSRGGVQLRFVFFGVPNNDCADWRSFRGFPNLRQALLHGASESALTAKSIFASVRKSLECTPQRRCGGMVDATDLKSVLAKSGVWVRIPSSAPLKQRFLLGDSLGYAASNIRASSRTKTHEKSVYSSSIRQVNSIDFESNRLRSFRSK
jgi:hypothetical protein